MVGLGGVKNTDRGGEKGDFLGGQRRERWGDLKGRNKEHEQNVEKYSNVADSIGASSGV